jgi:hypothetical protein
MSRKTFDEKMLRRGLEGLRKESVPAHLQYLLVRAVEQCGCTAWHLSPLGQATDESTSTDGNKRHM